MHPSSPWFRLPGSVIAALIIAVDLPTPTPAADVAAEVAAPAPAPDPTASAPAAAPESDSVPDAEDRQDEPRRWHHAGVEYHLLVTKPRDIRVVWADDDGRALRTFPAVHDHVRSLNEQPQVIVNGGIFEPGGIPSGLLVQYGRALRPLNTAEGRGNFYLQPNGVFFVSDRTAGVVTTAEYAHRPPQDVRHAVQSGPLLLRQGRRHPAFNRESESRLHRNGVGVREDGMVVLLMTEFTSDKFPNLWEFAGAFLELDCPDALFLDGDLCQLRTGESMRQPGNHMGSFIVVVAPPDDDD